MQSLSSKLGELKNKLAHRKGIAVEALPEVLSFPALSYRVMWDDERIILNGFVRVTEKILDKFRSKSCGAWTSGQTSQARSWQISSFGATLMSLSTIGTYLGIDAVPGDNRRFQFSLCVCETRWTILAEAPKKMKMQFFTRGKGGMEYDMQRGEREIYLSGRFGLADLEASGGVCDGALKVCFKIFY